MNNKKRNVSALKKLKRAILFASILYFILAAPLLYLAHSKSFYEFNYEKQGTYNKVDENYIEEGTFNLIGYFRYENELNSLWSQKEREHFSEVREMYRDLIILLIITGLLIVALYEREAVRRYTLINSVIILSLILIIPFFALFWEKIFHNIFFSNDFWITYPGELSYYLFEQIFFKNAAIAIIFISSALNLAFKLIAKISD